MRALTDSALMLGLVTASGLGPMLLLSVWGGVVADRVDRRKLVMISRTIFASLAFLTGLLIAVGVIRPWHVIAISLSTSILLAFDIPSRQAMVASLIPRERLANAIGLYSILPGGAAVIGPALLAPLVTSMGLEGLFFVIAAAYVLTVLLLAVMTPLDAPSRPTSKRMWQDLIEGLQYIREQRGITILILLGAVSGIFGMSFTTLLPIFADDVLAGGIGIYSLLLFGEGLGGLVGAVFLAWGANTRNSAYFLLLAGAGFGLGLVLFSQISWMPAAISAMVLIGVFSVVFMTVNNVLVQSLVAEEYRGRVMSIHQLAWGTTAFGGILMGLLAQAFDTPFTLMIGGLITTTATILLGLPNLRRVSLPA